MNRQFYLRLHRYAGLSMAFFLTVAGLTGSILAFYPELNARCQPPTRISPGSTLLNPFDLRERALAAEPNARINVVVFNLAPDQAYIAHLEGSRYEQLELNPYSGEIIKRLSHARPDAEPLTPHKILDFIYKLHFSLALGTPGQILLGITALIWTVDCFIGFYLTLPKRLRPLNRLGPRWSIAWGIKWRASQQRLNFDIHRAGGLWTWPLLLLFAWSSVAFNLYDAVYQPLMSRLFTLPDPNTFPRPRLPAPQPEPGLSWRTAHRLGQGLMAAQAQQQHFTVLREELLFYDPDTAVFGYQVRSDRDLGSGIGASVVYFDANNGGFVTLSLATGQYAGKTINTWLMQLHTARWGGLPYKLLVCATGVAVATVSISGVYIWRQKRRALSLRKPS